MIGGFLINSEDEIAFAQLNPHEKLRHFCVTHDAGTCLVAYDDGRDDMFTHEIPEQLLPRFRSARTILVVEIDPEGLPLNEYEVPVLHS